MKVKTLQFTVDVELINPCLDNMDAAKTSSHIAIKRLLHAFKLLDTDTYIKSVKVHSIAGTVCVARDEV